MGIIKQYWPLLNTFKHFKFTVTKPTLVYTSNKNIKSQLVRAKLPSLDYNTTQPPMIELPLNLSSTVT